MSFYLNFTAKTPEIALQLIDRASVQNQSAFLKSALKNATGVVQVKANGHLATGSDFFVSSATLKVTPLTIAENVS